LKNLFNWDRIVVISKVKNHITNRILK